MGTNRPLDESKYVIQDFGYKVLGNFLGTDFG
jgi:hypothetical protein